jgi:hypothetical protein
LRILTLTGRCVDDSGEYLTKADRIAGQCAASACARHFGHGAAQVDVDEIRAFGGDDPGGVCHVIGIASEDLNAHWALFLGEIDHFARPFTAEPHGGGAEEFRADQAGSLLFAEESERVIRVARHGTKHKGTIGDNRAVPHTDHYKR